MLCQSAIAFLLVAGAVAADGEEKPLSALVAEGIGRRFPPTAPPLVLDPWPTPLRESPGAMMAVAISSDGSLVATGCGHPNQAGELVIWDAKTGREQMVLPFARGVRSVEFMNDGQRIAAGGYDGVARLIDLKSGATLQEFRGHTDAVNSLALTPDNGRLTTGSLDGTIILWNVADGSIAQTFRGHTDDVLTVAIDRDGKRLASAGRDKTIKLWDLDSGRLLQTLEGHEELIETVSFSPDGVRVASASWDGTVRLWDLESGTAIRTLRPPATRMVSLAFSPADSTLAAGGFDGKIVLWDHANDRILKQFDVRPAAVFSLAYSGNGSRLASCSFDGMANLWKADGAPLKELVRRVAWQGAEQSITGAAWLADDGLIATAHADGEVRLTVAETGQGAGELRSDDAAIRCLVLAADRSAFFAGADSGGVFLGSRGAERAVTTKFQLTKLATHVAAISCLALSANGKFLAACGADGTIQILDPKAGTTLAQAAADSAIQCAAFDSSNRRLLTGHADGRVRLWHAASCKEIPCDLRLTGGVVALATAPAGEAIATADGQTVSLWRVAFEAGSAKAKMQKAFTSPEGPLTALAFTPDSQQLVTGDQSGSVRIWDVATGNQRALPRKHPAGVTAVALAPRSRQLLTVAGDGSAWIWAPPADSGVVMPIASIPAHDKGTRNIALTPDGKHLISDGYDNHVRVWDLESTEPERDLAAVDTASSCTLLPKGTRIAIGRWGKRIQICDLGTGQPQENYPGLPRGPYAIAVSPDESRMLAVFREMGVKLFDLTSFEADPLVTLAPDELPFTYAAFAPDGAAFATCTGDHERMELPGKLRLHDAKTGAVLRTFEGHTSEVKYASFDATGKRLASCSGDKTVRLWDVATGELIATLDHPIGTFSATFVPESDLLMTSDYHGTLRLWDLRTKSAVQQLSCHSDFLGRVALSSDLSVVASSSRDGTVKLWQLEGRGNELRVVSPPTAKSTSNPE